MQISEMKINKLSFISDIGLNVRVNMPLAVTLTSWRRKQTTNLSVVTGKRLGLLGKYNRKTLIYGFRAVR